jgi:hypothetical protein
MEIVCSSETSVHFYQTTCGHMPQSVLFELQSMHAVEMCDWKGVVIFFELISGGYEQLYLLG